MKKFHALLQNLKASQVGSVMPMAAVGTLVLAVMVGSAVDLSRAYKAKNRLQIACDAGSLAGRRAVTTNGWDTASEEQANKFFDVNFNDDQQDTRDTLREFTSEDDGRTVTGAVSTTLDTIIMQLFGFNNFNLSVNCSATMGVGNADVTMVLDTTGSMLQNAAGKTPSGSETSRLQDLQAAMRNFYRTLANASAGSDARIRYAFVPYAHAVNVGALIADRNPNFLVDNWTIQSRRLVSSTASPTTSNGNTTDGSSTRYSSTRYSSRSNCNSALPSATAWTDKGNPTTSQDVTYGSNNQYTDDKVHQEQTRTNYTCVQEGSYYYVYSYPQTRTVTTTTRTTRYMQYEAIPYSMTDFKKFEWVTTQTGDWGANVTSRWSGCIEERSTTPAASFSFSSLTGISPDVPEMDIDTPPNPANSSTQWAPMWEQVAYYRATSGTNISSSKTGSSAEYGCPRAAQLLQEMTEQEFDAYAGSLSAKGGTYHDIGMLWAARISSPEGIWRDNVTEDPGNGATVSRHILFMTDGFMDTSNWVMSSWGVEFHDRRITSDGTETQADARHTSRFLALCEAVKAKGIRVWVVAFGTTLTTDLSTCASDQSAYTASNAAQLNTAFQEIAKQVGELRVIQ